MRTMRTLWLVLIGIATVGCALLITGAALSGIVTDDRTIIVQEKLGAQGLHGDYRIIDTDGNVYSIEDNNLLAVSDASSRYEKLQEGGMYKIHTTGVRIPVLSWYPNIVSSTQAISLETNSCYLKEVVNESVI